MTGATAARAATTVLAADVQPAAPTGELAREYADAADRVRRLTADTLVEYGGQLVGTRPAPADPASGGAGEHRSDDIVAEFRTARPAVAAAAALSSATAGTGHLAGVRVGLHTVHPGSAGEPAAGVRHCRDVRDVANLGQVLLTSAAAAAAATALPPGHRLADLGFHRLADLAGGVRLHALVPADQPARQPLSVDRVPNNLPGQLTSFVGRTAERAAVRASLTRDRLVTLTGAGGAGKTRLGVHAVAGLLGSWPDGIWWVDLSATGDPGRIPGLVAAAVGVRLGADQTAAALAARVRHRRMLICLDTCEHLLAGCADLVDTVLRTSPGVTVLATSREPLDVPGETVWRVPPLAAEQAAALFVDRAARDGRVIDEADASALGVLIGGLDGLPLAVELAAGWAPVLTLEQIADGLQDRLRTLATHTRGRPDRQRTLDASMQWSHDLLRETERVVFRRLGWFEGEFDLAAADAVCTDDQVSSADLLLVLARLVDTSLLTTRHRGDEVRYRMLDTVRQYAQARLADAGEAGVIRGRHLDHFLAVAERHEPGLEHEQDRARTALAKDRDNLDAAVAYGLQLPDPDRGRRLTAALAPYWFLTGQAHHGIPTVRAALDLAPDDESATQTRLYAGLAMLGMVSPRFEMTEQAADRGLALAERHHDQHSRARCLAVACYRWFLFDFDRCAELARTGYAAATAGTDLFARDWTQVMEAYTLITRDQHDRAADLGRRGLAGSVPRGDRFCAAMALGVVLWAAAVSGDLPAAREAGERALEFARPLGDFFAHGTVTASQVMVLGMMGDLPAAHALIDPLVRPFEDTPDTEIVGFRATYGNLLLRAGNLDAALTQLQLGAAFAAPQLENWTAIRSMPGLAGVLRRLGRTEEALRVARRGETLARAFRGPRLVAQFLDEQGQVMVADDPAAAERLHHEALQIRLDHGLRTFYPDSLDALAACAARAGSPLEATRLLAASDAGRAALTYPRPPVDHHPHRALIDQLHEQLSEEDFATAWSEGSALDLADSISYVRRARGSRGRPATGWASLTPTEHDVVRLVSQGLTNPQVAARLFISLSTVKTHLRHIFAKLGVANRTELTRQAAAHLDR